MSIFKSKTVRYFLLLIFLGMAVAIFYGYKEYNRTTKDIASITPSFTLNTKSIIDEFVKNDSLSTAKYIGKTILLNGNLKNVEKDENGFYTLIFSDSTTNTAVRCSMDSIHNNEAKAMQPGTTINIKGICTGFIADELGLGADIMINNSCITKNDN